MSGIASSPAETEAPGSHKRDVVVVILWLAIVTGLVEAAGSVALQRAGRLSGVWWDLLWASPLFDIVLFGAVAAAMALLERLLHKPRLILVLPALGFLTASIWLGLALPYQVHVGALVLLSAGCAIQFGRVLQRRLERALTFARQTLPAVLAMGVVASLSVLLGRPLREHFGVSGLPAPTPNAPSVVLIVIDALRADHLSTHGYERETSPTIARLASEGVSFQAAFSTSPYTAPSHASLLTGLYPSAHGVQWLERRPILTAGHPTLAEAMLARGYRTAALSANRFWFTREQGFGRGFLHFEDNFHTLGDALVRTAYGRKLEEWVLRRLFEDYPFRRKAVAVTDAAVAWAGSDREHPFFLMLNYFDVHDPYLPPAPYRGRFAEVPEPGGLLNSHQNQYHPELSPEQLSEEIDAYDGAIAYVDGEIERLIVELRALGPVDDGLLVVVTSDHGEAFGEHGAYIHANSLYREEIHVPLIFWWPGRLPSGFRSSAPVSNSVVPSTILDLVGGSAGPRLGGEAVTALWQGGAVRVEPSWPISEMEHWSWNLESSPSHYGAIQAVLDSEFHLIRNDSLGDELYRWGVDPRETTNLVTVDSLAGTVSRLRAVLDSTAGAR